MNIPGELVAAIASGNAALFIGAGLSMGAGLPSWGQLIGPLAGRLGVPDDQHGDLLRIAQFYENQRGRQALISYIQEQIDTQAVAPTANHRRLVRLGVRTWVTTNFDDLLEQTLREAGVRVGKVVRDQDLPYASADRLTLIKLHGDSAQPETMVITRQDYNTYTRRFPRLKEKLSGLLVEKTFLLIGYSISDPDFNQLLDEVAFDLQQHRRMAFAVLFDADALTIDDLRARNIQVLNIPASPHVDRPAQLGALLDALILAVEQAGQAAPAAPVSPTTSIPQPAAAPASTGAVAAAPPQPAARPAPSSGDGRLDYERGLRSLGQYVTADGEQDTADYYLFQARLLENLQAERRYGPTETTRAERSRIIDQLNPLALRLAGLSFTDLCMGKILAR